MTQTHANDHILVADIGGTNTRVALAKDATLIPSTIRRFRNSAYSGLTPVIHEYLSKEKAVKIAGACVAAAGPVHDDVAEMTNLDWTIDKPSLAQASGAQTVAILNDLQAQGHALGFLDQASLRPIITGAIPKANATKLVIGVGTGFNAAPIFETPQGRLVTPSECGHINLPVHNDEQRRLSDFIKCKHGFAGVEEALSGRGLERVYEWVSGESGETQLKSAADIMASVELKNDPQALKTIQVFSDILATAASNLALIHLPLGGIYLVGGVTRAIAPYLRANGFEKAFTDKGRFSDFLEDFPVQVVEDDYAALTGCAHHLAALSHL